VRRKHAQVEEPSRFRRRLFNALGSDRVDQAVLLRTIELLETDPLDSAGEFPGDMLRRLMDLPAHAWTGQAELHARYREVIRAGALARRGMQEHLRVAFWRNLPNHLDEV
jgi:hypothetical protein